MPHTGNFGAKIAAAVIGGLVGFCLGPFLGSAAGALIGNAFGSPGPGPSEVGNVIGLAAGLIGGAWLGAFLVGRPVVAGWCLGTAGVLGVVSFVAGFAGPILLSPDSPQGPLLGIFFTGPLGVVVGALIGLCIGLVKRGIATARGRHDRSPKELTGSANARGAALMPVPKR